MHKVKLTPPSLQVQFVNYFVRNSATETVKQELLFVGQESGKMIAIRDIIREVTHFLLSLIIHYLTSFL